MTADEQSRLYGDANPTLTYAVGGSGLVNGDAVSGSLATNAASTSGVGIYGITQGSLSAAANPNYLLAEDNYLEPRLRIVDAGHTC